MIKMLQLMTVALLLLVTGTVWAMDEEFDTEAEEVLAESDATGAQAAAQRERMRIEKAEAAQMEKDAKRMKKAAEARRKQSEVEIVALEKQIKDARTKLERARAEKTAAEKSIAHDEAKLAQSEAFLKKLSLENAHIRQMRLEQKKKAAALKEKMQSIASARDNELRTRAPASMKFAKECAVFDQPSVNATIVGKRPAGSPLQGRAFGGWVAYPNKDNRMVFVQKNCF